MAEGTSGSLSLLSPISAKVYLNEEIESIEVHLTPKASRALKIMALQYGWKLEDTLVSTVIFAMSQLHPEIDTSKW